MFDHKEAKGLTMIRTETVSFISDTGQTLFGKLEIASTKSSIYAIFAHCFTCSKNSHAANRISKALAKHQINVLRFDFTGIGESSGTLSESHFNANIDDIISAAKFLEENYSAPQLLVGHSLGGAAILAAASKIPSVKAVSTIGAPFDPSHVKKHFRAAVDKLKSEDMTVTVSIGGKDFEISRDFLNHLEDHDQINTIKNLNLPILVFHSPQDQIVPISNAKHIYEAAHHPKSFISLDEADHLLTKAKDANFVASSLAAWALRYIETEKPRIKARTQIHIHGNDNYLQQRIDIGEHQIFADEPITFGGTDQGPTPYELLLASLGSCTAMTLIMYAKRKHWHLGDIHVTLTHNRVHAKDCELSEKETGLIDVIERHIEIQNDLGQENMERLRQIADRCPVHKTMSQGPVIKTNINAPFHEE